jgi:hypothetical protein
MENNKIQVPAAEAGGAVGRGLATEPAPIDIPVNTWHIVEKGIMVNPTFTITIKARQAIVVSDRDVEVEIDRFGLSIRTGDTELIIDPRYNSAELRKRDKLVAISSKVRYRWIFGQEYEKVYEAKDFAQLVMRSVKGLIEETVNITSFS